MQIILSIYKQTVELRYEKQINKDLEGIKFKKNPNFRVPL